MSSYSYLNNIGLEEALESYIDQLSKLGVKGSAEEIDVRRALGRVTSEAVYARISSPHYNACAMDGIAVCARSTFGATDTTPVILKEGGDYIRVDTGDPLNERFDAVVMIEDVIENGPGTVKLIGAAAPWQHIRQIGEDICADEMILPSNTKIDAPAIGAMLAGGVLSIKVWKRPRVGIIPTGDEVVMPTATPEEGDVLEFNSSIFASMVTAWGAEPKIYGIVPDRYELLKNAVVKASLECDVVIINAGSSAGRDDYSSKVIAETGQVFTHGIAIRPGKPTILGAVNRKPVIGVPGYPVSGIIVMDNVIKQVLQTLMGTASTKEVKVQAVLTRKIISSLKYKEFVRMKLGYVGDKLVATPLNRGAGVVTSFVKADGIMEIPMNSEGYESGTPVEIKLLKSMDEIRNTTVVIGSHDPLIDVVSDIMRRNYTGEYVSSAHVGSMGGIMAIRRGEAHIAGIHLLDEQTGEYNTSYVKKYFPGDEIEIIKCVKRIQGLMIKKGNPAGIKTVKDICRDGVRYVNRQKGSGTRILLDYLIKKESMEPQQIYGYEREEYTHMAVAALVASGSADVGMGIYSAARIYDLDFIPVWEEEYDFIIPRHFLNVQQVQHFIEILRTDVFKKVLKDMGGYVVTV